MDCYYTKVSKTSYNFLYLTLHVLQVIRERYLGLDVIAGPDFQIQFEEDMICLPIPSNGLDLNGWEIRPLGPLAVS